MTSVNRTYLYYVPFVLAFFSTFISLTAYSSFISSNILLLIKLISITVLGFKILIDFEYELIKIYLVIIVTLILIFNTLITHSVDLLLLWTLMLGSKNIDAKKFTQLSFILITSSLIFTIISSAINIIPNYVYTRTGLDGKVTTRYSLGTSYPTIFGSILFFISLQYMNLYQKHSNYIRTLLVIIAAIIVSKVSDNRLVVVLLVIAAVISLIRLENLMKYMKKILWLIPYLLILFPMIFIYISYNYDWSSKNYILLNTFFNNRVTLSWQAFQDYPITLFGQFIKMNGFGNNNILSFGEQYFYIDSLPVLLLMRYGILIFILYLVYIFYFSKKLISSRDYMLLLIFILIVMYDIVDNKSISICLNPFPILLFNKYFIRNLPRSPKL